jgi:PqqD family protein of HPr-rel-A system
LLAYLGYSEKRMRPSGDRRTLAGLMQGRSDEGSGNASLNAAPAMSVPESYRPTKRADVVELDTGEELILYHHPSSLVHHLNPSAALVWRLCDGDTTVMRLTREVAQEYRLAPAQVAQQVMGVVAEFDALDLVEDAGTA